MRGWFLSQAAIFYFRMFSEPMIPETYVILPISLNTAVKHMSIYGGMYLRWNRTLICIHIPHNISQEDTCTIESKDTSGETASFGRIWDMQNAWQGRI
jgi:hypothetical protein